MEKYIHLYGSLSLCFVLYFTSLCHTALGSRQITYRGRDNLSGEYDDSTFNVLDFGAIGDGSSYDNEAFEAAWTAACKADGGVMVVPSGHTFLLKPITFSGDECQTNVVVQVDGKIVAPSNKSDWKNSGRQWITFQDCEKGLTIRGNGGVLDGQGEAWWKPKREYGSHSKSDAPHAVLISGCLNVTVTGITILNSPQMHIFIEKSQQVEVFNFTVSSPADSRNTDGIHLSRTQHVDIHNSTLACGDDCISIQTGCSDVRVYGVNCGPGHGYSIGSLGHDGTEAMVSDIIIQDSNVQNSMTGVRIKTWEGGSGLVRNVTFSNIKMLDVKTPITIDQHYNENSQVGKDQQDNERAKVRKDEGSAVAITDITYQNITGTYTRESVSLLCSEQEPCKNLTMANIDLTPSAYEGKKSSERPYCLHAYGEVLTSTLPPLHDCLETV